MQRRLINLSLSRDLEYGNTQTNKAKTISVVFIALLITFILWSALGLYYGTQILLWLTVLAGWILSLTFHEYGHAITAYMGGDHTVMERGYLTLNFLLYMDPIMSLLIPVLLLVLGGIALPGGSVLVQTSNVRSAHWEAMTSLAGPIGNILFAIVLRIGLLLISLTSVALGKNDLVYQGATGKAWSVLIVLQGVAAILNLIPLPPLDGWGVVSPYLSASCWLKSWLNRSKWNMRTMSLVTFGLIYCVGVTTPIMSSATGPLKRVFWLDNDLLVQGFHQFFGFLF